VRWQVRLNTRHFRSRGQQFPDDPFLALQVLVRDGQLFSVAGVEVRGGVGIPAVSGFFTDHFRVEDLLGLSL
jgi:hypothetical protein